MVVIKNLMPGAALLGERKFHEGCFIFRNRFRIILIMMNCGLCFSFRTTQNVSHRTREEKCVGELVEIVHHVQGRLGLKIATLNRSHQQITRAEKNESANYLLRQKIRIEMEHVMYKILSNEIFPCSWLRRRVLIDRME